MGIKNVDSDEVALVMSQIARQFQKNAESFYDKETMEKGFMVAKDREGVLKQIDLITVSVAVLELPRQTCRHCSIEKAGNIIAELKKQAKHS